MDPLTDGIALTQALVVLEAARLQVGALNVTAAYTTRHGIVAVLVEEGGHQLYVNGERVPSS